MCSESQADVKVLKDRTKGLDARGNVAINTQTESRWAVDTLNALDGQAALVDLLGDDLEDMYKLAKTQRKGDKFVLGYERLFGTGPVRKAATAKEIIKLMLDEAVDFKGAVDDVHGVQKETHRDLDRKLRQQPEYQDRGRSHIMQRRQSFCNPHAGIADHVFRETETENFFESDITHAKGRFAADGKSATYGKFKAQGMPFIGGVSGTMQQLVMRWEVKAPLAGIDDVGLRTATRKQREKLIGLHMAALLAGGHHSAGEMLVSAKAYGYFPDVQDPLANYPKAMKQLGDSLQANGLPGSFTPNPRRIWEAAKQAVRDQLTKLKQAFAKVYIASDLGGLNVALDAKAQVRLKVYVTPGDDPLVLLLDQIVAEVDDARARKVLVTTAHGWLDQLKQEAAHAFVAQLDSNPFVKLTIAKTIVKALNQLYLA